MIGRRRRERKRAGSGARPFDAATEEPDLIEAERGARRLAREPRQADRSKPPPLMVHPTSPARRSPVEADPAAAGLRRRRRRALVAIGAAVAAAGAALAALSPLASVHQVEVVGAPRTGVEAVRAASGLEAQPPLLRVDAGQVAASVQELPWVRTATVERRWPRTVVLRVDEREPAAVAPCRAGADTGCLVDATGRVLAPASSDRRASAGLPRLTGVPEAGEPGSTLAGTASGALAVATSLPSALRPLVLGIRGDGPEVVIDLRAPGREQAPPVVRVGPPDRIQDKLTAAATVLARTSVNGVAVLDVRVPESPALTRVKR